MTGSRTISRRTMLTVIRGPFAHCFWLKRAVCILSAIITANAPEAFAAPECKEAALVRVAIGHSVVAIPSIHQPEFTELDPSLRSKLSRRPVRPSDPGFQYNSLKQVIQYCQSAGDKPWRVDGVLIALKPENFKSSLSSAFADARIFHVAIRTAPRELVYARSKWEPATSTFLMAEPKPRNFLSREPLIGMGRVYLESPSRDANVASLYSHYSRSLLLQVSSGRSAEFLSRDIAVFRALDAAMKEILRPVR